MEHQNSGTTSAARSARSATRSRTRDDVLVVVDGTESSRKALIYTARMLAGCDADIHLAYIAPRVPARLLEFGGSEVPEQEERLDAELHRKQRGWIDVAQQAPDAVLEAAGHILRQSGVDTNRISTYVSSPLDLRADAEEILLVARDEACQTIVVGHSLSNDSGEKLAQALIRLGGHTIWSVG